jgi:hypothetical protein
MPITLTTIISINATLYRLAHFRAAPLQYLLRATVFPKLFINLRLKHPIL